MFKHKECPQCKRKNHHNSQHCSRCGEVLTSVSKYNSHVVLSIAILFLITGTAFASNFLKKDPVKPVSLITRSPTIAPSPSQTPSPSLSPTISVNTAPPPIILTTSTPVVNKNPQTSSSPKMAPTKTPTSTSAPTSELVPAPTPTSTADPRIEQKISKAKENMQINLEIADQYQKEIESASDELSKIPDEYAALTDSQFGGNPFLSGQAAQQREQTIQNEINGFQSQRNYYLSQYKYWNQIYTNLIK